MKHFHSYFHSNSANFPTNRLNSPSNPFPNASGCSLQIMNLPTVRVSSRRVCRNWFICRRLRLRERKLKNIGIIYWLTRLNKSRRGRLRLWRSSIIIFRRSWRETPEILSKGGSILFTDHIIFSILVIHLIFHHQKLNFLKAKYLKPSRLDIL